MRLVSKPYKETEENDCKLTVKGDKRKKEKKMKFKVSWNSMKRYIGKKGKKRGFY